MSNGILGRALRAVVLVGAAWAGTGCMDSIVGAECDPEDLRCLAARSDAEGARDAGPAPTGDPDPDSDSDADPDPDPDSDPDSDADPGSDPGTDPDPVVDPELVCPEPLVECRDECVDLSSDPRNCGGCGVVCDSGICVEGTCDDDAAGHVVVIGHDFGVQNGALERVLGNAVFLAVDASPQVVVYTERATPGAVIRAGRAIDQYASAIGRSWTPITATGADAVPSLLATADVLLVHAQPSATADQVSAIGVAWQEELTALTARGGVVIVLDGGHDGGAHELLAPTGLFAASQTTEVSGEVVSVAATNDAVAIGVPLHYLAPSRSISFALDVPGIDVVRAASGLPVVVHRPVE
ncbi:MAG TPA: hypothetical protein VMZ28_03090 [Kofleriaceae bacterium]|nr:hypothetical protein [Kofleriaceae bacterium]